MLYQVVAAALAFSPTAMPGGHSTASRSVIAMSAEPVVRREFLTTAASFAAATVAMPAFADGATSAQQKARSRVLYGSRVYRLQTASAAEILDDENAFTLFVSGAYRTGDQKADRVALQKLQKSIMSAAKKGDTSAAQEGVKQFVALGKIEEKDTLKEGFFNPTQRRNPGAPGTAEIEAQMGTLSATLGTEGYKAKL